MTCGRGPASLKRPGRNSKDIRHVRDLDDPRLCRRDLRPQPLRVRPTRLSRARLRGAALITGAARRIGRALAFECAAAGFDVAIHAREIDHDADSLVEAIREKGLRAVAMTGDLADAETPARLIDEAN